MAIDTPVCFVVMGFGKKTDYPSGRTLDLDATYEAIIKPSAQQQGLRCIRADEAIHSGVIDAEMYEMLLRADLVIADISTGNVNAVYELGVRHALKPNATIIMTEQDGSLYFDLNHINTFRYKHLGEDIGVREAERAKQALTNLIRASLDSDKPDSPIYTYLPRLKCPVLSEEKYGDLLDEMEATQDQLVNYIRSGELAKREGMHADASEHFLNASKMKKGDPYIIQQLALTQYKSRVPSPLEAAITALETIKELNPAESNDPETLGICGAIRKNLWLITQDRIQLDEAIKCYARGFEVRRDYYNGENLANCYGLRSKIQESPDEYLYDRMSGQKVRATLVATLMDVIRSPEFEERSDQKWIYATLANCYFGLSKTDNAIKFEQLFLGSEPDGWEVETYESGKRLALSTLSDDGGVAHG